LYQSVPVTTMVDGGLGISAAVAIGSKFIEPSKFSSRHDGSYDKEVEKSLYVADRFEKIPKEDVDYFEAEVYNALHSKCVGSSCVLSANEFHLSPPDR
jgi:hypothetical protein